MKKAGRESLGLLKERVLKGEQQGLGKSEQWG